MSGRSRFALPSVHVGPLVVFGFLPFGGLFVGGFSPPASTDVHSSHVFSYVISGNGLSKWIKTVGESFIGFEISASREELGDSLDKYSVNCDISPN